MAASIVSKMKSFRTWRVQHLYMQMEGSEQESTTRSSFQGLHRIGPTTVTEWPNIQFDEEYRTYQEDDGSISSTPEIRSRFSPTRHTAPRDLGFLTRLKRMVTLFPVRDISWIVAFSFTIGSAVFVVNGFFLLLPLIVPSTDFAIQSPYATPASSVLGTLIFLIGGYAGYLEGLNLQRIEMIITEGKDDEAIEFTEIKMEMDEELSATETEPKSNLLSQSASDDTLETRPSRSSMSTINIEDPKVAQATILPPRLNDPAFIYWPTMYQLRKYYARSLLFHAGLSQFIGTIIFSMATLTSLPGILPSSPRSPLLIPLLNLLPASLGGLLFLLSASLQTLSAQSRWYIPAPWKGDWQVGFWNIIGSLGFTLAGALPVLGTAEADQMAILADFWGSWAFLIGSLCQLFGVMKHYS